MDFHTIEAERTLCEQFPSGTPVRVHYTIGSEFYRTLGRVVEARQSDEDKRWRIEVELVGGQRCLFQVTALDKANLLDLMAAEAQGGTTE